MREKICLNSFNDYSSIPKGEIVQTYFNNYLKKNVDLTICDFYWLSSRKTYLPCGEKFDIYSYQSIIQCLLKGARLLNFDIYNNELNIPIIKDVNPMPLYGNPLDFEKAMKIVNFFAWIDNSNYPLILLLNFHTNNNITFNITAKILFNIFKNRFLDKKYAYNSQNANFPLIPIKDCLGKVIIISNKYPLNNNLNEFINGSNIKTIRYDRSVSQYGGINDKDLLEYNMKNITIIDTGEYHQELENNIFQALFNQNLRNPKSDIFNPDTTKLFELGCQIILMNFQLPDDNFRKYLEKFNNPLMLKPENLRYIEKPQPKIKQQDKDLSFKPQTIEQKGWFKLNM